MVSLFATGVFAQVITSSLNVFVTDPSGAAVPEANITIRETNTGVTRTQTTNSQGQYALSGIPAGSYDITASPHRISDLDTFGADFQLQVGNMQQSIEVAATPALLQTENASLAVTIASR